MMGTAMMRVREDIRALLLQLAEEEGMNMQELLSRALEDYRRARLFERADAAYAALQADPAAWQQELEERRAWDVTLMDGIDAPQDHAIAH
jgi:predicted kinase